ncbi:SDR family NAD(P)-dependent oxidoreductase [Speluncibacter jeojiensis]|uniref:SDR family NAD(P)-dependent oxidoreductase n=1 Tax=Speluncibacter jeojiensis TaxID=2710754 RepID=A0A9X4RCN6_9ACTN|nr:SDR family NAD(P)-dependent oxidoreductase [Corynebacteriales bacterium D3-21]
MTVTAAVDTVLDRTIVPGYSRLGYAVRSRTWRAGDPPAAALAGATVLVTGANSGIGKAVAAAAARLGATVLMTVRNRQRGESVRRELLRDNPEADLVVERCDVSDLADVREFAAGLMGRHGRIDALIHNAGVLPPARAETGQGHELSLATHVLGPLLLTELLLPALAEAPSPRVVLMSSGGMYAQPLPSGDLEYRRGAYRGATAYARSKRIQVALTPILSRRWVEHRVTVAAMHPGWVDTPGLAQSLPLFRRITAPLLRTARQGADTAVWLAATTPAPPSGHFWHDRRIRPTHYRRATRATQDEVDRVWGYCARAAGLDP